MSGVHLRKYGVEFTVNFDLFEVDGVDFRVDAVYAAGDVKIMKNEGAEANTANSFTDEGTGYSHVITATEAQAARIVLYYVDQTATKVWLDKKVVIETYGHASAQHAFDLDSAIDATAGSIDNVALVATTTTNTDMRGTDGANTTVPDAAGTAPTAVEVRQEMDTNSVDLNSILSNQTAIAGLITALNNISVSGVLTTQMTESYAADGTAPTLAQALFLIQQAATEFAISGTTKTIKKLDGATTAATETLDSATEPTSITRTT